MSRKLWGMLACSENLDADVKMYEAMLGTKARVEWDGCKSIAFGDTKLYVMDAPNATPFMVIQVEDIKTEVARLKKEGFSVMDPFQVRVGIFAFFEDKKGAQHGLLQLAAP